MALLTTTHTDGEVVETEVPDGFDPATATLEDFNDAGVHNWGTVTRWELGESAPADDDEPAPKKTKKK